MTDDNNKHAIWAFCLQALITTFQQQMVVLYHWWRQTKLSAFLLRLSDPLNDPPPFLSGLSAVYLRNREEKSLRHVAMVAKFLDDNKPIKSLKSLFALFQTSPILFNFI